MSCILLREVIREFLHSLVSLSDSVDVIDVTEDNVTVFVVILAFVAFPGYFVPKSSHVRTRVVYHQSGMVFLGCYCFRDLKKQLLIV